MASSSSSVLLVAVVLAAVVCGAHGIAKVPPGPNITASPASYGNKWLDAKTTWVPLTDKNWDPLPPSHFALSGHAFGSMAKKGEEQKLRDAGEVEIKFRRGKCKYPAGTKVNFHVEKSSNENYLALVIKFLQGDGDVVGVDIKQKGEDKWTELNESWGAVWRIDTPHKLIGPFSVRYTTEGGTKTVVDDVIPKGWKPDTSYEAKGAY
ncbi:Pollen allergen Phl p 1 [Triticum urartu]|uniref:Pollen allergen Phl p 1 n=1 Tax=Triticum urartu TaxID=4572 RepID=M7Z649_TRIUA|nr:Pollen allergen Phl p 1 [Triticum urartu]